MAGEDKCGLQPHKTISDTERSRRQSAVNYARASVGLEGLSLSEADEAHAQRFIDGQISLQEFVQPRADALALPKSLS
ncbi:antitoxin VbhA family protein [Bordetella bronchiseptica]